MDDKNDGFTDGASDGADVKAPKRARKPKAKAKAEEPKKTPKRRPISAARMAKIVEPVLEAGRVKLYRVALLKHVEGLKLPAGSAEDLHEETLKTLGRDVERANRKIIKAQARFERLTKKR